MPALLLSFLSAIWSTVNICIRALVRWDWLKAKRLPVRVVSVGNLQVGGAGKTPLVALIAQEAKERGFCVCILSRGYGGAWESRGGVISPGAEVAHPTLCGDEPALLHELAPEAWIGVGRDRFRQFEAVCSQAGVSIDLVILDDGFQHWKLHKDLEVLALTSQRRTQRLFREWDWAARFADLRVWTKGEIPPRASLNGHPEKSDSEVRIRMRPRVWSGEFLAQGALWLVTGLADGPEACRSVEAAGFRVVRHLNFPDHARYSAPIVKQIIEDARANSAVVAITGKDGVKWRELGFDLTRLVIFEPEIDFLEGREAWLKKLWANSP